MTKVNSNLPINNTNELNTDNKTYILYNSNQSKSNDITYTTNSEQKYLKIFESYEYRRCNLKSYSKYFKQLFIDIYWAGSCPDSNMDIEKQLCQNRDMLAEKYNLKKNIKPEKIKKKYYKYIIIYNFKEIEQEKKKQYNLYNIYNYSDSIKIKKYNIYYKKYVNDCCNNYNEFFEFRDHIEYYLTNDNKIVSLFSKYFKSDDPIIKYIEKSGYIKTEPIYELNQSTYIKVIDMNNV